MKRFRHDCPECKKEGRRRRLECCLTLTRGEYIHWVKCPKHGQQIACKGVGK